MCSRECACAQVCVVVVGLSVGGWVCGWVGVQQHPAISLRSPSQDAPSN